MNRIFFLFLGLIGLANELEAQSMVDKPFTQYFGSTESMDIGFAIKPFRFKMLNGEAVNSEKLKGKVVLLDFWATWCGPCRSLTGRVDSLIGNYHGRDDFQMIGVNHKENLTGKSDDPATYWKNTGHKFSTVLNGDSYAESVNAGHPTMILIDKAGNVVGRWDAWSPQIADEIATAVWFLLEQPAASIAHIRKQQRDKEHLKVVYLSDVFIREQPDKANLVISEKFFSLLALSEWDAYDFIKPVIDTLTNPEEQDRIIANTAIDIAQSANVLSKDVNAYAISLFDRLIKEFNGGKDFIVLDQQAKVKFRVGDQLGAVATQELAINVAKTSGANVETVNYLQNMLEQYKAGKLTPVEKISDVASAAPIQIVKPIDKKAYINTQAKDFTQNDVAGKPVRLSDYRGKYVLVDFWASWCAPCREENPNLVAAYAKYKDKGLEILGVSLDKNKEAWLKAIKDDNLLWTQVSDLKGWQNEASQLYEVNSVPDNVLIDPTGKIIARKLRDQFLEEFLSEIFK
ncbi:redoxin domain-containing protein [Sphingobacterium bambusae]|uniref:Redoxin domain-containing protein n=1 Tax=Sphingobacterium bambusae TaxID=662858 RepID=A0ABW6BGW4_9SPHI|nr:redoxin domain-containing protein [Sphingobacterium bambusae]WPL49432.1 redoxin domain-containing protein [Sphingobacterium bambusae]